MYTKNNASPLRTWCFPCQSTQPPGNKNQDTDGGAIQNNNALTSKVGSSSGKRQLKEKNARRARKSSLAFRYKLRLLARDKRYSLKASKPFYKGHCNQQTENPE